jgi:membrane fusion protein (multidrug efflux system)
MLQGKPSPSAVSVYVIKSEKLENTLNASGTIVANEEVELKPEVAGKIISLPLKEGTTVQKNDLLVKINDADYQAQLRKLQLQSDLATTKLNRDKELLKINGISKEEYDIAENAVKSIKADMDYTEAEIAKTEIRAPFNGMLGLKSVSEGAYVSIGTIVATVVQTDPVKIDFTVSEKYSPFMKKGVKVLFTIDGIKNDMTGEIYAIEPKIDASLRTLTVRAVCPNKDGSIYPGAFANVRVLLKDIDDAVMIPSEALIPELRGKKVFIVKNGKSSPVMIETGIRTSTKVQVLKGLQVGDTVITTGIMGLKPDAPVRIMPAK